MPCVVIDPKSFAPDKGSPFPSSEQYATWIKRLLTNAGFDLAIIRDDKGRVKAAKTIWETQFPNGNIQFEQGQ